MKRSILNTLILISFLMGLAIFPAHTSFAGNLADNQISRFSEDPNEPDSENAFNDNQLTYLTEDEKPDEPDSEAAFNDGQVIYLTEDANEPELESTIT